MSGRRRRRDWKSTAVPADVSYLSCSLRNTVRRDVRSTELTHSKRSCNSWPSFGLSWRLREHAGAQSEPSRLALSFEGVAFGVRTQPLRFSVKRTLRSALTERYLKSPTPYAASTSTNLKAEKFVKRFCFGGGTALAMGMPVKYAVLVQAP